MEQKMDLTEICVDIAYPEDLVKVKKILINANHVIEHENFKFLKISDLENHLMLGVRGWFIGNTMFRKVISVEDFEKLINESHFCDSCSCTVEHLEDGLCSDCYADEML
jgi:hypothetical protein